MTMPLTTRPYLSAKKEVGVLAQGAKHHPGPKEMGDIAPVVSRVVDSVFSALSENPGRLVVYTDGSSSSKRGSGGWGWVLDSGCDRLVLCCGGCAGTSSAMELMAAASWVSVLYEALKVFNLHSLAGWDSPVRVEMFSDSIYLVRGLNDWIYGWKAFGWETYSGEPVVNKVLWAHLDDTVRVIVSAYQAEVAEVRYFHQKRDSTLGGQVAHAMANMGRLMYQRDGLSCAPGALPGLYATKVVAACPLIDVVGSIDLLGMVESSGGDGDELLLLLGSSA